MKQVQSLSIKEAEISYRRKLLKQHQSRQVFFAHEPTYKEIIKILTSRVKRTKGLFSNFKKKGLVLSPFLEIGAERGQRSSLMVNEFRAHGFALDISLESLGSAQFFNKALGLKKMPNLVCADAYRLPFSDNSFPFVFCFETLHHFPDPEPIVKEIYRVLSPGGFFYVDEEPIKQVINLRLWRRGYRLKWYEELLKKIYLLPFLSSIGGTETTQGVLENEFSLKKWRESLKPFANCSLTLKPTFFGPWDKLNKSAGRFSRQGLLNKFLISLQGGGVTALCRKKGRLKNPQKDLLSLLVCPDCQSKLIKSPKSFKCRCCGREFPIKKRVALLLPQKLRNKLYP